MSASVRGKSMIRKSIRYNIVMLCNIYRVDLKTGEGMRKSFSTAFRFGLGEIESDAF